MLTLIQFLSTLSLRRATRYSLRHSAQGRHFYPRSPCGERRGSRTGCPTNHYFYPRSPCGERRVHFDNYNLHCVISIHALLAESDFTFSLPLVLILSFLSTLSLRRATLFALLCNLLHHDFYPRSPCGERPMGLDGRFKL